MAECFCGCGRNIPFGRRAISNKGARRMRREVDVLRGAATSDPPPESVEELRAIVARADGLLAHWREYVHGDLGRSELDRDALRGLVDEVLDQRKRLALDDDFVGWNALGASELFSTGRRARARIVSIRDTGMTVNQQPRAEITLRVEPDGEEPFDVQRKLVISRVNLPKVGEWVEVAYDPHDRSKFTFRVADLTDDALQAAEPGGADHLDQIQKLHELHQAGALTAEEFAREKARLLGAADVP